MTSRMHHAVSRLKTRLKESAGLTVTVTDGADRVVALQITVTRLDTDRAIRAESEYQLEVDDCAFLIDVCDMRETPQVGWMIHTGDVEYRITERPELESCWRWHDREEVSRTVFAKEWIRR